jgi:polar amino acid transport system permease protein
LAQRSIVPDTGRVPAWHVLDLLTLAGSGRISAVRLDSLETPGRERSGAVFWARPARSSVLATLQFALLCAALIWLTVRGAANMGYNWQWYRVPDYFARVVDERLVWGPLAFGFVETIRLSAIAFVLTVLLGLVVAVLRLSRSPVGRAVAIGYTELIRNTPLLVQLYIFYFVLAPIVAMDRYWTAIFCLTVFEAAFAAEIFRAGIMAVPKGQWEAAASLGLERWQAYRDIVLPQAVRFVLPPLTGLAVSLVKHSSIVSVIAVFELTTEGRNIISDTYMSFEIWLTVAGLYLSITVTLSLLAAWLERRFEVAS